MTRDPKEITWRGKRIVDMSRDELEQAFAQLAAKHNRTLADAMTDIRVLRFAASRR